MLYGLLFALVISGEGKKKSESVVFQAALLELAKR